MAAPQMAKTGPPVARTVRMDGPDQRRQDPSFAPEPATGSHSGNSKDGDSDLPVRRTVRAWPLVLLALPASVAVWSGWVGIGQLTGFGEVRPLPGIWNSLHLDSAITLPVGVEAYAAYALHAWLAASVSLTERTRRFAKWSAIGSLLLGMAGQVAYHLLTQAGIARAPWEITTAVACLPVLILGMAAGLTHLIRADARVIGDAAPAFQESLTSQADEVGRVENPARLAEAEKTARQLITTGRRVSRRSLRAAGLRGSNAELGQLARKLSSLAG